GRSFAGSGAGVAHRARCAASPRLRPRRARGGEGYVRAATAAARGEGGSPGGGLSPGAAEREGPAAAGQVQVLRPAVSGLAQLVAAVVLVALAGVLAAVDSALNTVSTARVGELVRDERPGAVRLARVVADRPKYVNLIVLLRI